VFHLKFSHRNVPEGLMVLELQIGEMKSGIIENSHF